MGFALAEAAAIRGAEVTLVTGPTNETVDCQSITVVHVTSGDQMLEACTANFAKADIAIMSAAVADYKPKVQATEKIKKNGATMSIELEKTTDILKNLGAAKQKQILVGFALETNNELENAKSKLVSKNLDLIVLNSLNDKDATFKSDTNKITIIDKQNNCTDFELKSKFDVAQDILNSIESLI